MNNGKIEHIIPIRIENQEDRQMMGNNKSTGIIPLTSTEGGAIGGGKSIVLPAPSSQQQKQQHQQEQQLQQLQQEHQQQQQERQQQQQQERQQQEHQQQQQYHQQQQEQQHQQYQQQQPHQLQHERIIPIINSNEEDEETKNDKKLNDIKIKIVEYEKKINGLDNIKELKIIDECLTNELIRLDELKLNNHVELKFKRKEIIKYINEIIKLIEMKIQ